MIAPEPSPFAVGFHAGFELLAQTAQPPTPTPVMQTGIWPLDYSLGGGLRPGEVTIICAPTGHGKSALAEQIALAISREHRTTFFALEMGRRRTEMRMVAKILRWDLASVKNLWDTNRQHEHLKSAIIELCYEHQLIIEERDDTEIFTANHLFAMAIANAPRFIVIDHPRLLDDWNGMVGTRTDIAAAGIARRFVACAKYLGAHVLVVAQTKADLSSKRPSARDVADTYVLAQAADAVVMLHRPYRGQGSKDTVAELIVDKNRNGPEGIVHARWHGSRMAYGELTPAEEHALECCKARKTSRKPEVEPEPDEPLDPAEVWGTA